MVERGQNERRGVFLTKKDSRKEMLREFIGAKESGISSNKITWNEVDRYQNYLSGCLYTLYLKIDHRDRNSIFG